MLHTSSRLRDYVFAVYVKLDTYTLFCWCCLRPLVDCVYVMISLRLRHRLSNVDDVVCIVCTSNFYHVYVVALVLYTPNCCWVCIRTLDDRIRTFRDANESSTESTDSDIGWGGLGMFEYGQKGLPHALVHAKELVETYGHHGACCTCVGEAGHKSNIKSASKFARVYGDRNETQDGMLQYVQRQQLWLAINDINATEAVEDSNVHPVGHNSNEDTNEDGTSECKTYKLCEPLPDLTKDWSSMRPVGTRPPRPPPVWDSKFLSKRLLITQTELVTLLRTKLEMDDTWPNIILLATQLHWECFGSLLIVDQDGKNRKVVGTSDVSRERRDFVRLQGSKDNAALAVQVCQIT